MLILNHELFDDLKCCGNCKNRITLEFGQCAIANSISDGICRKWKYDNLKKSDRWVEAE